MRAVWYIFLLTAAIVGIIVYALILVPLVVWRAREQRQPPQFKNNPILEITYTVIPLLIVIGLFFVTYAAELPVDRVHNHPAVVVGVTAFRWSWRFQYANGLTSTGTPEQPPTLYLPVGKISEIDLQSVDVTHSFWVPALLFKRDAIPGFLNRFDVTPTRLGTFDGKCAQFCGLDHALMTFTLKVISDKAFTRYLSSNGVVIP